MKMSNVTAVQAAALRLRYPILYCLLRRQHIKIYVTRVQVLTFDYPPALKYSQSLLQNKLSTNFQLFKKMIILHL